MATWSMKVGSVGSNAQNRRSPGWIWPSGTAGPVSAWPAAVRGRSIPAAANDQPTRPEQSKPVGPVPPHTYGLPTRLSAAVSAVDSWVALTRPAVALPPAGGDNPGRIRTAEAPGAIAFSAVSSTKGSAAGALRTTPASVARP